MWLLGCLPGFSGGRWEMLIVETIDRIRREHLVKGKSIKEIARDLKVSRNTVSKVLRSGGLPLLRTDVLPYVLPPLPR